MVESIDTVAVLGTGEMGTPVVSHLVEAGYDVSAFDVAEDARQRAAERGATVADSPGEAAAEADLSLVLVGTSAQVESVLCGTDGVFEHAKEGHVVALGSTLSPEECMTYAEVADAAGLDVVDVPTCRGGDAAVQGELLTLCGGDSTVLERIRPVLEQFSAEGDVVHLGDVGAGQVAKSANNTLLWTNLVADYEVLTLAKTYGLDPETLRSVLMRSSGDNWVLHQWDWIHSKWAHKDMAITMAMAAEQDVALPLSGLTRQVVQSIDQADLDQLR
jgi:3-hydroxyisobutyrate dehydrogenase-like beta-hydroxyacid dehydrogenase